MKVKELMSVIFDKIIIYKANIEGENFTDIYKGDTNNIPLDILEMEVRCIGASKKQL